MAEWKNMQKEKVDQIITDYLKKLYGFAVKKSFSYDEAEDLCSEIILKPLGHLNGREALLINEWKFVDISYTKGYN